MLFRTKQGKIVEINRRDYSTDTLYYSKIVKIKKNNNDEEVSKYSDNTCKDKIIKLLNY